MQVASSPVRSKVTASSPVDRVLYMVDGRIVADRHQGRFHATHEQQRHADVTAWLTRLDHRPAVAATVAS